MAALGADDPGIERALLKAGTRLLVGRQGGALVFMGAVVVLPRLVSRADFDAFMWAYVAELLVSSILGLGLERLAAADAADRDKSRLPALFVARLLSLPLTAAAVLLVLGAVHVHLAWTALGLVVLWSFAVQVQGLLFAAMRGSGQYRLESVAAASVRFVQATLLVLAAAGGASLTALTAAVAVPELVVALLVSRSGTVDLRLAWPWSLPWRRLAAYTLIEVLGFAYLRSDSLIVGNILGAGPGATYSLAYRVLDGMTAMLAPFLLHLFPAARRTTRGEPATPRLRRSLLGWAPLVATSAAVLTVFGAAAAVHLVARLGDARAALEVLVVTLPLYCFSAVELHLRSAEGRDRSPVFLGTALLVLNVVLNVALIRTYGLVAAAWVLVACEALQAAYLGVGLWRAGAVDRPVLAGCGVGVVLLAVTAALAARDQLGIATIAAAACATAVAWSAWFIVKRGAGTASPPEDRTGHALHGTD